VEEAAAPGRGHARATRAAGEARRRSPSFPRVGARWVGLWTLKQAAPEELEGGKNWKIVIVNRQKRKRAADGT
jgi:hypothetical protein